MRTVWFIVIVAGIIYFGVYKLTRKNVENKAKKSDARENECRPFNLGKLYDIYTPGNQKIKRNTNCPKCGAPLQFDPNNPKTYCAFCGCFVPEFQEIIANAKYEHRNLEYIKNKAMEEERQYKLKNKEQLVRMMEILGPLLAIILIIILISLGRR